MANNFITYGAKFQPFSYERYLAPLQMYEQSYREMEDAYTDLITKSGIWEKLASSPVDKDTYSQYESYSSELQKQADLLAKEGLNANSRKALSTMKKRYSSEISPIEIAYTKREEDIKRQKDLFDKSQGAIRFSKDARNTPLSTYMKSGDTSYNTVNLDTEIAKAAQAAKTMSARRTITEEEKAFTNDYLNLVQRNGIRSEDALAILNKQYGAKFEDFAKYIQDTHDRVNYNSFNDIDKQAIDAAISSGYNTGILYSEESKLVDDWRTKMELQQKQYLDRMQQQAEYDLLGFPLQEALGNYPKGTRIKDLGYGRAKITLPDGTVKYEVPRDESGNIISTSSTKTTKTAVPGYNSKKQPFIGAQFIANDKGIKGSIQPGLTTGASTTSTGMGKRNVGQVQTSDLPGNIREQLRVYLLEYNLELDDVIVIEDWDRVNKNHYKVIPKDLSLAGWSAKDYLTMPVMKKWEEAEYSQKSGRNQIPYKDFLSSIKNEGIHTSKASEYSETNADGGL